MYTLLTQVESLGGNIQVTTRQIAKPHSFDLLLDKDASIVELLKPFLDAAWDPISRMVRPNSIVAKLSDINKACVELYCHLLDRDWPLVVLNISPLGTISERNALDMAAAYYKHVDRHTPPLLKQPLVEFPDLSQYSIATQKLLKRNGKFASKNVRFGCDAAHLVVVEEDVKMLDWTNMYLLRRLGMERLILRGQFEEETMARFLPQLQDVPVRCLRVVEEISDKCIAMLSDYVWQSSRLFELDLNHVNIPTFLKLESTANFFPLFPPHYSIKYEDRNSSDAKMEFVMAETKNHGVTASNAGHWDDWVERCPSLIHATRLMCSTENIIDVAHTLTQLEALRLFRPEGRHLIVFPPNLRKLYMDIDMPHHQVWKRHEFPQSLQKLEIECHSQDRHCPIDLVLQPLTALSRLQKLAISYFRLEEPKSCSPDLKHWPHLTHLWLRLATVKMVHQLLASVPTTQWQKLRISIDEDDPERPGMFEGLEDADWGNLRKLELDFIDLKIHSNMLKQFHGLASLSVDKVSDDLLFSSLLLEGLNPDIHTHLQVIRCDRPYNTEDMAWLDSRNIELSSELVAELQMWPNLIAFPGCDRKQRERNRFRQIKLKELATRRLLLECSDISQF